MLKITVPKGEIFNSNTNTFCSIEKDTELSLEHSLVSISKWESKWHKPFLSKEKKTNEELIDYVKCMTITQNVSDEVYSLLSQKNVKDINEYIENSMTATTFNTNQNRNSESSYRRSEILTSEIIYYWMFANQIPMKCETWHLNRLLTLIRVCNIKNNSNNSKMSKREVMSNNRALNEARKAKYGTHG